MSDTGNMAQALCSAEFRARVLRDRLKHTVAALEQALQILSAIDEACSYTVPAGRLSRVLWEPEAETARAAALHAGRAALDELDGWHL